ncbi:AAA-ATPase [Artemisia annua]|uniref:AAA-ATPase n=1 Tax=Artemisia annua TaxID=35608 RepID=A0A2U1NGS9_ARTAN|nr:AAA-ATPase [Artemisia annua]
MNDEHIKIKLADSEMIVDSYEGVTVTWKYHSQQQNQRRASSGDNQEKTYMKLIFDKNYKDIIISSYLPFIIKKAQEIKNQNRAVQLHSLQSYYRGHREGRKDFYKKVGKAWKRGYLLYGPPGTGKSSLIAAMANYLKFDIYELQLMNVHGDASLREFSLSGLLNFIDGLWSCYGDERIIIFTTNHKERLDPALLRPGRMDRFEEISDLIKCKKVTPAEVAEELMKSDNVEVVLEGVVKFLKRKRIEEAENSELDKGIDGEDNEIHEAKKAKVIS